jgi:hypothetical protein
MKFKITAEDMDHWFSLHFIDGVSRSMLDTCRAANKLEVKLAQTDSVERCLRASV